VTTVAFVVGHEDSRDSPSDTPEAYWRVLVPARELGGIPLVLGRRDAAQRALAADVVWIHQPTCFAAASLAEAAQAKGVPVVADFSEDPWARAQVDRPYSAARLDALERTLEASSLIVTTSAGLVPAFFSRGEVRVIPATLALGPQWNPSLPTRPAVLGWWSDGRQKRGMEAVAPGLIRVLESTDCRLAHVQFSHHAPLMAGLTNAEERMARARRLSALFEDDRSLDAEGNVAMYRQALALATISVECYAPGTYAETVSDVPLLRAAALGVPTVTTRKSAPPGCVSATPGEWAEVIAAVLQNPDRRRELSHAARAWAESRSSFAAYQAVIKEVTS